MIYPRLLEISENLDKIYTGEALPGKEITIEQDENLFCLTLSQEEATLVVGRDSREYASFKEVLNNIVIPLVRALITDFSVESIYVDSYGEVRVKVENDRMKGFIDVAMNSPWPTVELTGTVYDVLRNLARIETAYKSALPSEYSSFEYRMFDTTVKALIGARKLLGIDDGEAIKLSMMRTSDKDIEIEIAKDNQLITLIFIDTSWALTEDLDPEDLIALGNSIYTYHGREEDKNLIRGLREELVITLKKTKNIPKDIDVWVIDCKPTLLLRKDGVKIYVDKDTIRVEFQRGKAGIIVGELKRIREVIEKEKLSLPVDYIDRVIELIEEHREDLDSGEVWILPGVKFDKVILDTSPDRVSIERSKGKKTIVIPLFTANRLPGDVSSIVRALFDFAIVVSYSRDSTFEAIFKGGMLLGIRVSGNKVVIEDAICLREDSKGVIDRIVEKLREEGYSVSISEDIVFDGPTLALETDTGRRFVLSATKFSRCSDLTATFTLPSGTTLEVIHPNKNLRKLKIRCTDELIFGNKKHVKINFSTNRVHITVGKSRTGSFPMFIHGIEVE